MPVPTADTSVQYVKGVGPRRAEMLAKAGIETASDLLRYKPFRYEDRTNYRLIRDLRLGEEAVIQAQVVVTGTYTTPMKRVQIFEMRVADSSGSLSIKFFNQPYLERVFRKGQDVVLFGVPRIDDYSAGISLINPEYEILDAGADRSVHTGRIVPIYRKIGRLYTKSIRQILFQLLETLQPSGLPETLTPEILKRHRFPPLLEALRQIHFPVCPEGQDRKDCLSDLHENRTAAHLRMIFEEFFSFQLGLKVVRERRKLIPKNRTVGISERIREVIKSILPFHPTTAQKRVLREIVDDLRSPHVMSRLLQGDVGSGKTIVALQAIIVVVENGFQCVLMAPTEILAEQHFQNITAYLEKTDYKTTLLSGRVRGKRRRQTLAEIEDGQIDLVIGTHAVFQKGVRFRGLGLVVIDEQHRFGVIQRYQLMEKGERPDTLVMTATPIPRSLAMTLYGDLDLSIIDEMPPGRQPIKTLVKSEKQRQEVYQALRREVARGRQAYIVYPLIEESEKLDLRAATQMAEHLQNDIFPEYGVGLMHGRLKSEEKEELMRRFKAGEIQIMVSTTVIEVGIDVPNATLMVVEHAERFGLSQLHQLRGRIGRGSHAGYCVLVTDGAHTPEAYERLDIMRRSNDGFKIAEKDLEIRGPGEFLGTRQSGMPSFLFANIVRDRKLLEVAELEAERYLRELAGSGEENRRERLAEIATRWKGQFGLYEVG